MVAAAADVVGHPDLDHPRDGLPYGLVLGTFNIYLKWSKII